MALKPLKKKHCEYVECGKLYQPKTSKSRFCSDQCRSAQWKLDNIISDKQVIARLKDCERRIKRIEEKEFPLLIIDPPRQVYKKTDKQ